MTNKKINYEIGIEGPIGTVGEIGVKGELICPKCHSTVKEVFPNLTFDDNSCSYHRCDSCGWNSI